MRLLPDHDLTGWTTLQTLTATNYLNEFVDGHAVRCPYRFIESCWRHKTIPVHTPSHHIMEA